MLTSPEATATLLTHANCSATIAENTRAKAETALNAVVANLAERGISVISTLSFGNKNLIRVELSNDNFILLRWMED